MSNNKLMEAAADILASSKGKNGAPMEKMPGSEVEDLGGPTPQNSKPDDDSAKIHAGKGAKSAVAPTTKPSAASAKMEEIENYSLEELKEFMVSEEFEQLDELSKTTLASYQHKSRESFNKALKQMDANPVDLKYHHPGGMVDRGGMYRGEQRTKAAEVMKKRTAGFNRSYDRIGPNFDHVKK